MESQFTCLCGKTFTAANSFNAHKGSCKIHQIAVYGEDHYIQNKQLHLESIASARKIKLEKLQERKELELQDWLAAKHTCECCGKVLLEKYGSGRFCSKFCATSRPKSNISKQKVSDSVKSYHEHNISPISLRCQESYAQQPKFCAWCGAQLPYEKRYNQTCSTSCAAKCSGEKTKHRYDVFGKHVEGRHIVYKVTLIDDPRYYIGVRKTENIDFDGYLGSGKIIRRLVEKYGKEKFHRETLFEFTNSTDAYNKEKELLAVALLDPNCVNLASGGQGGKTH